jgi:hypothetical protein
VVEKRRSASVSRSASLCICWLEAVVSSSAAALAWVTWSSWFKLRGYGAHSRQTQGKRDARRKADDRCVSREGLRFVPKACSCFVARQIGHRRTEESYGENRRTLNLEEIPADGYVTGENAS